MKILSRPPKRRKRGEKKNRVPEWTSGIRTRDRYKHTSFYLKRIQNFKMLRCDERPGEPANIHRFFSSSQGTSSLVPMTEWTIADIPPNTLATAPFHRFAPWWACLSRRGGRHWNENRGWKRTTASFVPERTLSSTTPMSLAGGHSSLRTAFLQWT